MRKQNRRAGSAARRRNFRAIAQGHSMVSRYLPIVLLAALASNANAQDTLDVFRDGPDDAKIHKSGFVCPLHIGDFERDAAGQQDPETGADFCSYAALDGVYGTITLIPIAGSYDPKTSLAADFREQEQTGGRKIAEGTRTIADDPIYSRTYETSKLEDLHYRVQFTGAAVNGWAVELTAEYADPRDTAEKKAFVDAVYAAAQKQIVSK